MKEFIWEIKRMMSAKKYRHEHTDVEHEYQYYKYLVKVDIRNFFARLKFWRSRSDIPF